MIDLHMHSHYSQDSKEPPENLIEEAISKGAKIIGFSEHLDYDYIAAKIELPLTDINAYHTNAVKLKEKYKDKIDLLIGAEFAYHRDIQNLYTEEDKKYNFDYIINSVHIVDGLDPYFGKYFDGKTKHIAYERYLNLLLESVYATYDYQIIGHLGYVSRYGPYEDRLMYYKDFKNVIDEILIGIIEKDKTLEINTHTRDLPQDFFPSKDILTRYYQLGGRNISFGSDAHFVARVLEKYDSVIAFLKETGFKELSYFKNKKHLVMPL